MSLGWFWYFPYKIRKNTKAASMPNQVNEIEKKNRAEKLIRLSDILMDKYESKFIGKTMDIITEKNHKDEIVGFTSTYIKIYVNNSANILVNSIISVKLISRDSNYVYADIVEDK